jgi:hypothetical protein
MQESTTAKTSSRDRRACESHKLWLESFGSTADASLPRLVVLGVVQC